MADFCLRNLNVIFLIIVFVPKISQKRSPQVTLSVQERVNLLKFQIARQINNNKPPRSGITPINEDDYQYVDHRHEPRTPINEFDERKKDDQFRLPELLTKPTPKPSPVVNMESETKPVARMHKKIKRSRKETGRHLIKPVDTFYRRILYDESFLQRPMPLLHCQDLFTPIIAGYRKNYTTFHEGFIKPGDRSVIRLVRLLTLNTTFYSDDEMTQLLYQISNERIRFFEWEVDTVFYFISVLLGDRPHTFANLSLAILELIESWELDVSNTTALLNQAKIYRPPCVTTSGYEGSTRSSSGIIYSKLTTPKSTCATKKNKKCIEYVDVSPEDSF